MLRGGDDDRLLVTRAVRKRTWPGVWTNACCGHPQPCETLREAVSRHLADELGLTPTALVLGIGDFAYRAQMQDGTVEHEICPVVFARVSGDVQADPLEVDDHQWLHWPTWSVAALDDPDSLSPWSVEQIRQLFFAGVSPIDHLRTGDPADALLDVVPGRRLRVRPEHVDMLQIIRGRVDAHLSEFLADRSRDVPDAADAIEVLHAAVDSLTSGGGKRLRPAFVLWGAVAAGGAMSGAAALHAAASVELLHTFALLHDDVMDRSDIRRGRPTAHRWLSRYHGGLERDREWFGVCAAILAGDLAFVWADAMFDRLEQEPIGPGAMRRARERFTTLRTEVIAGQYLDLQTGCSPLADENDAARIALLKTARYTATRPLQIGAALSGGSELLLDQLAAYGDATGMSFQLRDDVLGVFGDEQMTGKSTADDLREGNGRCSSCARSTGHGRRSIDARSRPRPARPRRSGCRALPRRDRLVRGIGIDRGRHRRPRRTRPHCRLDAGVGRQWRADRLGPAGCPTRPLKPVPSLLVPIEAALVRR